MNMVKKQRNALAIFCAVTAGVYIAPAVTAAAAEEDRYTIIVDNTDAGFSSGPTHWPTASRASGYIGKNYAFDGKADPQPEAWARWTPEIPEAGDYEIYMNWTGPGNRATAAPLEIRHADGVDRDQILNQEAFAGDWYFIGTYRLNAGTDAYVQLSAASQGHTIADAVKFRRATPASLLAQLPESRFIEVGESFALFERLPSGVVASVNSSDNGIVAVGGEGIIARNVGITEVAVNLVSDQMSYERVIQVHVLPQGLEKMFAVEGIDATNPEEVDWAGLPLFEGQRAEIFRGVEGESAFSHHPKIVFWEGRFFAKWNDGYVGEDLPGQRVRYAVSEDGLNWSQPIDLTGRAEPRRFTACGFWVRDGELYALAALRDASGRDEHGVSFGTDDDPLLLGYRWDADSGTFATAPVTIAVNYFNGNIPELAPDGQWLMLGKSGRGSWGPMKAARGGVSAIDDWTIRDLPGAGTLEEAEWYTLPNDHLVAHFRTRGTRPFYLARSYSLDSGVTWSEPVVTDFPEQGARHHGILLSNGIYALLVNPHPRTRIPFSIALSRDGLVYDRIANVRNEATERRWSGRHKGNGYHYMRGYEHDGKLYTIYSVNKEDIEVTIIPLSEFEAMYQ
jgi:hypothetical protein